MCRIGRHLRFIYAWRKRVFQENWVIHFLVEFHIGGCLVIALFIVRLQLISDWMGFGTCGPRIEEIVNWLKSPVVLLRNLLFIHTILELNVWKSGEHLIWRYALADWRHSISRNYLSLSLGKQAFIYRLPLLLGISICWCFWLLNCAVVWSQR